uniref:Protein kinase domain-containing protein n=1 Tax=Panagrolaimus sp. ES5 TaxID=591445 RepID=A0AC34GVH2_9BILA
MMPLVGNIINLETFSDTWSNSSATKTAKVKTFIEEIEQLKNLRHRRICHLYVSNYRLRLLYAAPEALKLLGSNGKVPPSADIWALGCTLVTMLTQNPPYFKKLKDQTDQEVYKILNWDIIKKSKAECQQALLLSLDITSERKIIPSMNNGHIHTITNEEDDDKEIEEEAEINLLLNNHKKKQEHPHHHLKQNLPKRGTTVIEMDNNKDEVGIKIDADEHPIKFCFSFVGSRILIFLMLMVKWTLMVFSAACALSIVATSIFLSISIIYRLIKMSCQCELNEGKKNKTTKLYVEEPDADVVICGVKVIPRAVSEKRKRSIASKQRNKAESNDDETSPTNLPKGNVLNAIAILA